MAVILPLQHLAELASVFSLLDITDDPSKEIASRQMALLHASYYASISENILKRITDYYKDSLTDSLLLALAPPSLKELHLDSCHQVTSEGVIAIFHKCRNLQLLDLSRCDHIVSLSLFDSICSLSDLTLSSVILEACDNVTDQVVQCLLTGVANLKQLKLCCCSNITDRVFLINERKQLGVEMSNVNRDFEMKYGFVSDDSLSEFQCHLVSVDISGCHLTSMAILHLVTLSGPTLRDVDISCSRMDALAMWYLSGFSIPAVIQMLSTADPKNLPSELLQQQRDYYERKQKFLRLLSREHPITDTSNSDTTFVNILDYIQSKVAQLEDSKGEKINQSALLEDSKEDKMNQSALLKDSKEEKMNQSALLVDSKEDKMKKTNLKSRTYMHFEGLNNRPIEEIQNNMEAESIYYSNDVVSDTMGEEKKKIQSEFVPHVKDVDNEIIEVQKGNNQSTLVIDSKDVAGHPMREEKKKTNQSESVSLTKKVDPTEVQKAIDQSASLIDVKDVNSDQSASLIDVKDVNSDQSTSLIDVKDVNSDQSTSLIDVKDVNSDQSASLIDVKDVNSDQSASLIDLKDVNSDQSASLIDVKDVNSDQSVSLIDLKDVNSDQSASLIDLKDVNSDQSASLIDVKDVNSDLEGEKQNKLQSEFKFSSKDIKSSSVEEQNNIQSECLMHSKDVDCTPIADHKTDIQSSLPVDLITIFTDQSDNSFNRNKFDNQFLVEKKIDQSTLLSHRQLPNINQSESTFHEDHNKDDKKLFDQKCVDQSLLMYEQWKSESNQSDCALHRDVVDLDLPMSTDNFFFLNDELLPEPFNIHSRNAQDVNSNVRLDGSILNDGQSNINLNVRLDGSILTDAQESQSSIKDSETEDSDDRSASTDCQESVSISTSDKTCNSEIEKHFANITDISTSDKTCNSEIEKHFANITDFEANLDNENCDIQTRESLTRAHNSDEEKNHSAYFTDISTSDKTYNSEIEKPFANITDFETILDTENCDKQIRESLTRADNSVEANKIFSSNITSFSACRILINDSSFCRLCVEHFFSFNQNLKRLELTWFYLTNEALCCIAKYLHELKSLMLVDCNNVSDNLIRIVGVQCQKIEKLDLKGVCFFDDGIPVPFLLNRCLSSLSLSESRVTDLSMHLIMKAASSQIVDLDFSWCEDITEEGVNYVAASCSALRILNFRHCPASDKTLELLADNCQQLENLELSGVQDITDSAVVYLISHLPLLEVLDISWNIALTDASVTSLFRNCPSLRVAKLSGMKRLTTDAFTPIISNYPRWSNCKSRTLIQFKGRDRKLLQELDDHHYSSDEEYDDFYLPYRSTVYASSLRHLELEYCNFIEDEKLQEIVGICRGSLTIIDYYSEKVESSLGNLFLNLF